MHRDVASSTITELQALQQKLRRALIDGAFSGERGRRRLLQIERELIRCSDVAFHNQLGRQRFERKDKKDI